MDSINVFNYFKYGDIFTSRISVQYLSKFFHINFYHNLMPGLTKDLDNVTEIIGIPNSIEYTKFKTNDFYNLWVGSLQPYSCENGSCCFDSFKTILIRICNDLSIEIPEDIEILPSVNYEKLEYFDKINVFMENHKKKFQKIILLSTGPVESSQSLNFDFTYVVKKLTEDNPKVLFISTTDLSIQSENYISTSFIECERPDLLEISFISSFCDIIVGRASGPYTYCNTKQNLMDKDKTFISFNEYKSESTLYLESPSSKIWSNNYDLNFITETIQSKI